MSLLTGADKRATASSCTHGPPYVSFASYFKSNSCATQHRLLYLNTRRRICGGSWQRQVSNRNRQCKFGSFGSCDSFESAEGDLALLQHDSHGDSTFEASESVIGPWSQRILAEKNSLVSKHWIPGFVTNSANYKAACWTIRQPRGLLPAWSPSCNQACSAEWGAKHKGENVSVIICQCPQRDCDFHVSLRLPDHQIGGGVE